MRPFGASTLQTCSSCCCLLVPLSQLCFHIPSDCRSVRPFGVSTLLASYGKEGPQLYLVDPAGTMHVSSRE